jgi:DNA-binding CsgD family transcriptional regulator
VGDAAALAATPRPQLHGRERERARLAAFAAGVARGPTALLIRGEPGIGKTALWREGVAECRRAGYDVLVTRPAEEEMPLALVGLVDLFEGDELAEDALEPDADQFVRGRAVLAALRRAVSQRPVVLAIDDVQWLDSASARALRYGLRRLEGEPVGVLATVRPAIAAGDPLAVATALRPGCCDELELGPLDEAAIRRVLAGTVEAISRPTLRRIHEASGGNPLYAIELARALAAGGRPSGDLVLPESLQAAIARRLDELPPELLRLLEAASALGPRPARELRAPDDLLARAVREELLVVEEDLVVRFAHPLVGSVVYGRMTPLARRALHGELAGRAEDPDVRARHLALSTDGPDEAVARALDEAAERASARGASDLAAEFARHSLRLTPPGTEEAQRRALAELVHLAAAGEASRARGLADALVAELPSGPLRAEALVQRFYVGDDELEAGDALLARAVEEAGDDELLRGRVLDLLGWLRGTFRGDLPAGIACATEAVEVAERLGDARLRMLALAHLGHMHALAGDPRPDLMERAVALEGEIGGPRLGGSPRAWLAKQRFWAGDVAGARALLELVLADDERSGNELERPYRLYDLALLECAAGNLAVAEERVAQGIEAARDAENVDAEGWLLFPLGLVSAWVGRSDEARAAAASLLEWSDRRGRLPWQVRAKSVLGLLALSEGDAGSAAAELREAALLLERMGFGHPGALPILPDAVEALARAGETGAAGDLLARLETQAAAVESAWASAAALRSRGVLLLAQGELDAATAALERAAAEFDRLGHLPGAARAVLGHGRALLRAGRRRTAAAALADARDRFAAMGAAHWEERAAEELARAVPGRAADELTPAERRIAALVAEGLKNREIGQTLFMSVATVEAHLTRIYRKLDIRSRSELARLVADGTLPLGS